MIDEKGKIFGKLNIIDLIAIILIVAVVVLLGYKVMSSSDGFSDGGQKISFTVKVSGVDADVYEYIEEQLPGQLMASGQTLDGYVTAVEAEAVEGDQFVYSKDQVSNQIFTYGKDAGAYDLIFTIEAVLEDETTNTVGTQEVRAGRSYIIKTDKFELNNGLILDLEYLPETAN